MKIPINDDAPVVERQEVFINASPDRVWEVLTDIDNWPEWQSSVTKAQLKESLSEGSIFKWKAGGVKFTSRLHTVKVASEVGWTGKTFGASAVHNWYFYPQDSGTLVKVEESLQGILPSLFKKKFQKDLGTGMKKNLQELKAEAERTSH